MLILQVAVGTLFGGILVFYLISTDQQKKTLKQNIINLIDNVFEIFGILILAVISIGIIIGLFVNQEFTINLIWQFTKLSGYGVGMFLTLFGVPLFIFTAFGIALIVGQEKYKIIRKVFQFYGNLPVFISNIINFAILVAIVAAWWPIAFRLICGHWNGC